MENTREEIIKDYTEVISRCSELINAVDTKHGTYGEIEVRDIDVTPFGKVVHQYLRSIKWREIRIQ